MRQLIFLLLSLTAFAAFAIYVLMTTVDPYSTEQRMRLIFYTALFVFVACGSALFRMSVIPTFFHQHLYRSQLWSIFRQGVLLSIVCILFMMLQALRILTFWDALMIITSAILFEMFFRVRIPVARKE